MVDEPSGGSARPALSDVPDTEYSGLIARLPAPARPYAALMRLDRPIGTWLLYWPCAAGLALAGLGDRADLFAWFLLGAFAMRSAGCVYNDIVDRDLDARVARTRARPLASGALRVRQAWLLLAALLAIGLLVWWMLPLPAKIVALASLALVAAYPFMKRITWWPQAWLGLVFSWGALVGWFALEPLWWQPGVMLWAGCVFWVIGYDTLYAIQDKEDDALVGVKSSARRLDKGVQPGVAILYSLAVLGWALALFQVKPTLLAPAALLPVTLHLAWQVGRTDPADGTVALDLFRSNRWAGLLLTAACLTVGLSRGG